MPSIYKDAQLKYQVCPIILTGGLASQISGSMIPMLTFLSGPDARARLDLPFQEKDLDNAFGAFNVLPGGTLVNQQIAKYPFANQFVASNATIKEPLSIAVIMDAPMRGKNAWDEKQIVMTNLKNILEKHNLLGGTYTVYTPAYMYTDLIMVSLTDNSRGNNSLPQNAWRFEFEKPLVSLADLQEAYNIMMSKIANQTKTDGSTSGPQPGSTVAQTMVATNLNTGIGGQITSSVIPNMTAGADYNVAMNYPAVQSAAQFAYVGIT